MIGVSVLRLLERLEWLIDDALELRRLDAQKVLGILDRLSTRVETSPFRNNEEVVLLLGRLRRSASAAELQDEAVLDSFVKDGWSLVAEFLALSGEGGTEGGKRFRELHRGGCGVSRQARVGP